MPTIGAAAAATLLLLGVTGCTVDALAGEPRSSAVPPTATDAASDRQLPTGVIGSARVTGADGTSVAVVEIVSDGSDELEVRWFFR